MEEKLAGDIKVCDLHGLSLYQAKACVKALIDDCLSERVETVKIITGKDGHGNEPVLMKEIPKYVRKLGFEPDYPELSASGGELEKGFFFVDLSHAVSHFEKQDSESDDSNRVLTQDVLERLNKLKEAEQATAVEIAPVESPAPVVPELPQQPVVPQKVLGKINNITRNKDYKYIVELNEGKKPSLEVFNTVADLRKRLEGSFKITPRWENDMQKWEKEEKEREAAKPKRKFHYKGHKN